MRSRLFAHPPMTLGHSAQPGPTSHRGSASTNSIGLSPLGHIRCLAGLFTATRFVLRESSPENQGAATSSLSLTNSLGTAIGTGLTGAMVAASVRSTGDPLAGLTAELIIAVAIGFRWGCC